jgi:3-hydroxyisobutyrate dehydrogenase-like beta-hydroxyacid dehydrogenase
VAEAVRSTKADVLYAECNAIAPETTRQIGEIVTAAGARFADGGIIGGPPQGKPSDGRIYTSGPGANELAQLNQWGLNIPVVGPEIGQASGLKLCYAALTKGVQMLGTELLVAARALGLEESLKSEQQTGNVAKVREFLERAAPTMPPKAHRWAGEMEEVAKMFDSLGMTPRMLLGAADMCEFVAASPIGKETPETRQDRGLYEIVAALAETLPQPVRAG